MWIPIGAEGSSGRRPWTTIGLIVANVLAFMVAWPAERSALMQQEGALGRLASIELAIEQRHLPPRPAGDMAAHVPSRLRKQAGIEERFWQAYARGEVVSTDDNEFITWEEALERWEEARRQGPYWTWAVRAGSHNLLAPFTAMFLHFGFWHLFFNMVFLWAVGISLEEVWGPGFYLVVYLLGGLVSEIFFWAFTDDIGDSLSCGASGAVAALMGAFLARFWNRKLRVFFLFTLSVWRVPAWTLLGYWFLSELSAALGPDLGGVAHWAHVGGFVGGGILGLTLAGSNLEEIVRPEMERKHRESVKARHLAVADQVEARGDWRALDEALAAAIAVDPHDASLRLRVAQNCVTRGDGAGAWAQADEAMRLQWAAGERTALIDTWRWAASLPAARPTPLLLLRVADALADVAPHEAVQVAWRVLEAEPEEPLRTRALTRYAELLDAIGEAERAAQVRQHLG